MSKPKTNKCPCGQERAENRVVCPLCWYTAPGGLRHAVTFGSPQNKRRATKVLLHHAGQRKGVLLDGDQMLKVGGAV